MKKIKNLKFGKRFLAFVLAFTVITSTLGIYKLKRIKEVNRVKGYLEDFLTEDNYIDLSKISSDYAIESFSGKALHEALQDIDASYLRITDSFICDNDKIFTVKNAINYSNILWEDKDGSPVYEMYEPIRMTSDGGVFYIIPEGFTLEDIKVKSPNINYFQLDDTRIIVYKNDYESSYSLELKKK